MQIWPAIDLLGGKCVRLEQGDYQRETVFADDPVAVAKSFQDQGARHLHLVDLDGAFAGRTENFETVLRIRQAVGCALELGGGLRSLEAIGALLELTGLFSFFPRMSQKAMSIALNGTVISASAW